MERQEQIDVLVVDSHHIVAQGLALVVSSEQTMRVVGTAGSIKEAVELGALRRPDVVLMDLGLPDGDANAAISSIRAVSPTSKIMMVTGSADDNALAIAVDSGCAGYVHMTASTEELLNAVSTVAAGRAYFPTAALARLLRASLRSEWCPRGIRSRAGGPSTPGQWSHRRRHCSWHGALGAHGAQPHPAGHAAPRRSQSARRGRRRGAGGNPVGRDLQATAVGAALSSARAGRLSVPQHGGDSKVAGNGGVIDDVDRCLVP